MTEAQKKVVYSTIFLLGVVAIAFLLWYVFFRKPVSDVIIAENVNVVTGLPNINDLLQNININVNGEPVNEDPTLPGVDRVARGGLTDTDVLTPGVNALDPVVDGDGSSMRFYNPDDNKFYRVDGEGNISQIGSAEFPDVESISWGNTTDEVILEFPDGSNVYYDLKSGRQVTLPKEATEFDFSPTDSQISFKYLHTDKERRVLAVANPDGTGARTLESLGQNEGNVTVEWSPTGKVAAHYSEFVDLYRQELGFVGLKGENFKGTVVEGRGLRTEYAPNGEQMLYSVYSNATDNKASLWVVDADGNDIGKNRKELEVNTFANKCGFSSSSQYVYCGVPQDAKSGFGLVPELLDGVPDDIYRIDTKTGLKSKIATPVNDAGNNDYQVQSLTVSDDGKYLIFQDASGELIKVSLQ